MGGKNEDTKKFEASVPIATADIKHSPTPSHIHVNPLFPNTTYLAINKVWQKSKEKQSEETNKSIRTQLRYDTDIEIIRQRDGCDECVRSLMESIDNMQEKMDIIRREFLR